MKKAFLLLITVVILTSAAWLKVSAANATSDASIKATVYSEFFTDTVAGEKVPARMDTADADLQDLHCIATEQPGYVTCRFPTEYAGQQVPIELTKNGAMYVYIVDVPKN